MIRPIKFLPLLLPLIPVAAAFRFLGSDAGPFILWWAALTIPGLLFMPLSGRIFSQSPDKGCLLAKPLALLLPGLAVWTLSYLHLLPFRPIVIYLVIIASAVLVHLPRKNRAFWAEIPANPDFLIYWGAEEAMLGTTMLFWTFARGLSPALDSLEKFMDYGFMMSLWRTDFLPAKDMWLAGSSINYYYFGQYLATYWAKASGIHPAKAYNLAMAALFALTFCLSFAVALLIGSLVRKFRGRTARSLPVAYASATAILLTLGGNGHVFYYGGNAIGRWLHGLFSSIGLKVGTIDQMYWFADATRYIGYNPDTTDKTIHEFPYYSFLVADLHAHVVSLIPVLLMLGLLAVLIARLPGRQKKLAGFTFDPLWILAAVILAIFMMGNYWDFVIYFAVACLVLLFSAAQVKPTCSLTVAAPLVLLQAASVMLPFMLIQDVIAALLAYAFAAVLGWMIETRFSHPLTATGARASRLFLLAHVIALPFNASFEPIAKSIKPTVSSTPLVQLWVLYGFFILAGIVLVIDLWHEKQSSPFRTIDLFSQNRLQTPSRSHREISENPRAGFARRKNLYPEQDKPAGGSALSPGDRLLLIFLVCGIGLLIIPELVYVVDIYSGDYKRANTMFKFTYQAFILLSFVLAYAPIRLLFVRPLRSDRNNARRIAGLVLFLLFVPSLLYPLKVTTQWLGEFTRSRYQGIDGIRPFSLKDSSDLLGTAPGELADDYAAVLWLNENVTGQPVILESYGDSYTDYCRISAYTGLPTVIGWQTHEWLWRTSKTSPDAYQSVVVPRQTDVKTLYTSTNEQQVRTLLTRYEVRYIVIGNLERKKFASAETGGSTTVQPLVNESLLRSLGPVAFQSGNLVIISMQ